MGADVVELICERVHAVVEANGSFEDVVRAVARMSLSASAADLASACRRAEDRGRSDAVWQRTATCLQSIGATGLFRVVATDAWAGPRRVSSSERVRGAD